MTTDDTHDLRSAASTPMYSVEGGGEWLLTDAGKRLAEVQGIKAEFAPPDDRARTVWLRKATDCNPTWAIIEECAESSIGFGLNPEHVDWDKFYEALESFGWDMQDLGGTVDNRIRRNVRKAMRDGDIQL